MSDFLEFNCINSEASVRSKVINRFVKMSISKWFKNVDDVHSVKKDFSNFWFPTKEFFYKLYPEIILRPEQQAGLNMEWVFFPEYKNNPIIIYLHGGGYVIGGIESHRTIAARLAKKCQARVLLVDYRLAPENPFPAAVEDGLAAYHWVVDNFPDDQIFIGGDSAGGGLTIATMLAAKNKGLAMPKAAFGFSPWLDLDLRSNSLKTNVHTDYMIGKGPIAKWAQTYLAGADARTPLASPIYGNLAGLPPILLHVSSSEVLRDDSLRFANLAQAEGVRCNVEVWKDQLHAFQIVPAIIPEAEQSIQKIAEFLKTPGR